MRQLGDDLFRFDDTCAVYVLRTGREAALIDFGSGDILPSLPAIGVDRVTDVLLTHHHRDQGQGLARAVSAGARVWVPHAEQDLFTAVDAHWQARALYNDYNTRQDRFSLLEPVPIAGALKDYETRTLGRHTLEVVPAPGHTPGSICLLAEAGGQRVAFTGDLIAAPGKVWSLAATQWTYNGTEGVAASVASLLDLQERRPDVLLPSHGEPISPVDPAIDLLVGRLSALLHEHHANPRLFLLRGQPYVALTPHLLRNRTSVAAGYVLLSDSGAALLLDFGYDFVTGLAAGADRAARRPWLYTLPALKRDFGVRQIEVVVPTHYHDDHVAGLNLLRRVEGTQVWAAGCFAAVLEEPARYDLPCLWPDPIPVDRRLPLEQPIRWHEYELTLYPQPGHTRYAAAVSFQVDGVRVLAAGDQYQGDGATDWNYVYRNGFEAGDYRQAARLYRRLAPELILTGHWEPLWVPPGHVDALAARAELLERLHHDLLPPERLDCGGEALAGIEPYQATIPAGQPAVFQFTARNPYRHEATCEMRAVVPAGWVAEPDSACVRLAPCAAATQPFSVTPPPGPAVRRARIAADLTVDGRRLGQQAEALVTTLERESR